MGATTSCAMIVKNILFPPSIETLPQLTGIFDKKNADKMNRNHLFFNKVQGQLNITRRDHCLSYGRQKA